MVYEIKKYQDGTELVGVVFSANPPVEVRETLKAGGFSWDWYRHAWVSLNDREDWAIHAIVQSGLDAVKERPEPTKAEEKALHAYYDKPGIATYRIGSLWDQYSGKKVLEEISEEDRERILEGYIRAYAAFEKRINAYLKRYGMTKVRSWTYWREA